MAVDGNIVDGNIEENNEFLCEKNRIYLYGDFESNLSFVKLLSFLDNLQEKVAIEYNNEIVFSISSNGGQFNCVVPLLERIELYKTLGIKVTTVVLGRIASAAAMIAISGTKGCRYASDKSSYFLHYGQYNAGVLYNPEEVKRLCNEALFVFEKHLEIYNKYSNIPDLERKINMGDLYINGNDILEWGLADKFINNKQEENHVDNGKR